MASFAVLDATEGVRLADHAGVALARLAQGGLGALQQPLLDQLVAARLEDVQSPFVRATFEETPILSTRFGKLVLLLKF